MRLSTKAIQRSPAIALFATAGALIVMVATSCATAPAAAPTDTPVPPTATTAPPTATSAPPTPTTRPPTPTTAPMNTPAPVPTARQNAAAPNRQPPRPIALPADDAPHDNLTEWWYYNGHLKAADGTAYGFEFAIFQSVQRGAPVVYAAHFAITDRARQSFRYDQRSSVGSQIKQGADLVLRVADWTWRVTGDHHKLSARMDGYALDLDALAVRPPALHLGQGFVSFGSAGDSYYYSRTRMDARGTLAVGGAAKPVQGTAWMDHQWGDFLVLNQGGWDWFGLQLGDSGDLAISLVRGAAGQTALASYATYVDTSGKTVHIPADAMTVTATGTWSSPRSGAVYPSGWRIAVPQLGLSLVVAPVLRDQELDTRRSTGMIYWEGEVTVSGRRADRAVAGNGYVELTGYAR